MLTSANLVSIDEWVNTQVLRKEVRKSDGNKNDD